MFDAVALSWWLAVRLGWCLVLWSVCVVADWISVGLDVIGTWVALFWVSENKG